MRLTVESLLILWLAVSFTWAADCRWTGCQEVGGMTPLPEYIRGCAPQGRVEKRRESCHVLVQDHLLTPGIDYYCCSKECEPLPPGIYGQVSYEQFRNAVTSNGYPGPSEEQYNNFNCHASSFGRITSLQEAAMALAQLLHESDGLREKREYACADYQFSGKYRTPGCDAPGQYYFGRGYIQLTGCENYKAASRAIFGNDTLVRDPDLVARDDKVAWQTALWYWGERVHNAQGVQQGQFGSSTKAINGKEECSSPNHHQALKRFRFYGNVRKAFYLEGEGDPSGCA